MSSEAVQAAERIGYPVVVRPSYVLGGRSMEIVYDSEALRQFMEKAIDVSPGHPILIDKFLEDAIEVDVDAISDGTIPSLPGSWSISKRRASIPETAPASCPPSPFHRTFSILIEKQTKMIAKELRVVGLMNIQYAVKDGVLYVLEVNPRASRTIPFVSKAIGVPLAKLATKVMLGRSLQGPGLHGRPSIRTTFPSRRRSSPSAAFPMWIFSWGRR